MIFPKNITGPEFRQGDLTSFLFDGAELTLRSPIIPINTQNLDEVSRIKNFQNTQTNSWDVDNLNNPCFQLLQQMWTFEDKSTLDDIAQCHLYVSVIEVDEAQRAQQNLLAHESFKNLMLDWMNFSFSKNETPESIGNFNHFNMSALPRPDIDGITVQVRYSADMHPSPMGFISINDRFVLSISLELQSLHYAGRTNPYSEETLKQFEKDLFDDFLSHIKIEYSPELIEKIQSLKSKTPA